MAMKNSKILLESIKRLTDLDSERSEKVAQTIVKKHTIRAICEEPIIKGKNYELS